MKLLVVIANYRVTHLTIDCLRSIAEQIDAVPDTHVAVCENGTGDNSAERIQSAIDNNGWGRWCTLTAVSPNLGFTGGNNIILRPAMQSNNPPQYFLLLNADTIVRPNALKALATPSIRIRMSASRAAAWRIRMERRSVRFADFTHRLAI